MEISGYSSTIDSILGLPPTASRSEVNSENESHLVVRVESQDPDVRKVEDFLAGNVPQQGSNVAELIHKMIF
jgi:hypothetical protein